jgi:hypothetical protein
LEIYPVPRVLAHACEGTIFRFQHWQEKTKWVDQIPAIINDTEYPVRQTGTGSDLINKNSLKPQLTKNGKS